MLRSGFTLSELLVVVSILMILAGIAVPAFRFFQKESDLNNSAEEIVNTLRFSQNKTLASEGASRWGVYFSTSSTPHQYILFKGNSYALRDISFDEINKLPKSLEISEINLTGCCSEIVFSRLVGGTGQFGNLVLRSKDDPAKIRTVYIESSGLIGLFSFSPPSDENRKKDSRHIHFDYSRPIDTLTENLILTFEGAVTETIIIADNVKDGQIYWEGEINVGGEIQKLKIYTHRLNNPDSQFSIHRDRRYNNKALKIEISGDSSGTLLEYSADGLTTSKTSIYATEPIWQ